MGQISLTLPTVGAPNTTEDVKVRNALQAIQTDYNGNLSESNFAAGALTEAKMATGANGLAKGCFRAFRNAALSLVTGSVVPFDNDATAGNSWDVSSWFDTVTNIGRYTPQVAGYYEFNAHVFMVPVGTGGNWIALALYKNSVQYSQFGTVMLGGTTTLQTGGGGVIAQANGTTDFFEVVLNHNFGSTQSVQTGTGSTYFAGKLIGRS